MVSCTVWLAFCLTLIEMFLEPTWGPSGANRTHVGPRNLAIWVQVTLPFEFIFTCMIYLAHCILWKPLALIKTVVCHTEQRDHSLFPKSFSFVCALLYFVFILVQTIIPISFRVTSLVLLWYTKHIPYRKAWSNYLEYAKILRTYACASHFISFWYSQSPVISLFFS